MVLPFVRDLFADAEKLPGFTRVTTHLRANAGRIRVSGLNPPAKSLLIAELQKAAARPLIVIVRNNEAAGEVVSVVHRFCELVCGGSAANVVLLLVRDVLPFLT